MYIHCKYVWVCIYMYSMYMCVYVYVYILPSSRRRCSLEKDEQLQNKSQRCSIPLFIKYII